MTTRLNRPLVWIVLVFAPGVWCGVEYSAYRAAFGWVAGVWAAVAVAAFIISAIFRSGEKSPDRSRFFLKLFRTTALVAISLIGMFLGAHSVNPPLPAHHISNWAPPPASRRLPPVTFQGRLAQSPRRYPDRTYLYVEAERIIEEGRYMLTSGRVRVTVMRGCPKLEYGDRIIVRMVLKRAKNFSNPGSFDYERYLAAQGIFARGSITDGKGIVIVRERPPPVKGFRARVEMVRSSISEWIKDVGGRTPAQEKIMRALVVGDRWAVPRDVNDTFRRAGVVHLLAVSGLHLGLVASIAYFLVLGILSFSERLMLAIEVRRAAAVISIIPVIGYMLLAGGRVPTIRAAIMVTTYLLAMAVGRDKDLPSTIGLAAFVILLIWPASITEPGFVLSFGAVIAIAFVVPLIRYRFAEENPDEFPGWWRQIKRNVSATVVISFAIVLFMGPLVAGYFHHFSPLAPITNLIFIPLVGYMVLPLGLFAVLLHSVWGLGGDWLMSIGLTALEGIMELVKLFAKIPWTDKLAPSPTGFEIVLFMGLFVSVVRALGPPGGRRSMVRKAVLIISLVLVADVCLWYLFRGGRGDLRVTFLDVGEGSAAVAVLPDGKVLMVDTGIRFSTFDAGERIVGPYLLHERLGRIDAIAISHPHRDHIGGLEWLLEHFDVGELWMADTEYPEDYERKITGPAGRAQVPIRRLSRDSPPFEYGGAEIDVWWPPGGMKSSDLNDLSLVFRIMHGEVSFVFPGDAGEVVHEDILAPGLDYRATVLLAPHHGANDGVTGVLLERLRPIYAVVSARYSMYKPYPQRQSIELLDREGVAVLRTDEKGAIRFRSNGRRVEAWAWDGRRFRRIDLSGSSRSTTSGGSTSARVMR